MSEFKYACPVCGQHISCDSSQAGTIMECPTCFQKIIVPQAPTGDQKFILTGTKVGNERPMPKAPEEKAFLPRAKTFPVGIVVFLIFAIVAAAGIFILRGKFFKNNLPVPIAATNEIQKPKPIVVAPAASDTNWMLDLSAMTNFPDMTAAGRIHGKDFVVERAFLQNGTLTLREGRGGPVGFGVQINFGGAQPDALAGQSLNIATNAPMAARITLHWPDGSESASEDLEGGYAMRLKFGALEGNRLSGQIYFCAPDELKSYIAGNFTVQIRRPKAKQ